MLNDAEDDAGRVIARDMSFGLLDAETSWDFFDVLHVHSLELASQQLIDSVLDRCEREGKGVVVTIHDVFPMFETEGDGYIQKLRTVARRDIPLVTLTKGAADQYCAFVPDGQGPTVVPHGYVVPPEDPRFAPIHPSDPTQVTFLLYGGFRPNRSVYPACANAAFGVLPNDRVRVLTRGISPVELQEGADAHRTVELAMSLRGRVDLDIAAFPSDDDVADFLIEGQVLVMPYLWGTHSGQLEVAFDLGLVAVASDVGFLREQWQAHRGLVPEPIWFDWSDGGVYAYGSRLVEALLAGRDRAVRDDRNMSDGFRQHRAEEHQMILDRHADLYEQAMKR